MSDSRKMQEPFVIGRSRAIRNLLDFVQKAASSDSNVLLLGETGVGKEIAAMSIHYQSKKRHGPFCKLNCANLCENLTESELFGYQKGAFTGAFGNKLGLIEAANGGTFLFDEIGDISPWFQAKVLSVVEDKVIRRIGDNNTRKIDTRFIFATNKDLRTLVSKGKFREDLYYRISILTHTIPPLRKRNEDIPLLINEFIERINATIPTKISIDESAIVKLCEYSFPGNVRELENILKRAADFCVNKVISDGDIIFQPIYQQNSKAARGKYKTLDILNVLFECENNKTKAAKQLGMSRVHLYRLLRKIDI